MAFGVSLLLIGNIITSRAGYVACGYGIQWALSGIYHSQSQVTVMASKYLH